MISFKAKLINSATVNRISTNTPVKTSFVELSPFSPKDMCCVKDVAESWSSAGSFASNIKNHFLDCNWLGWSNCKRFFALTLQRNNFEELNPDEILGLAQITDTNIDKIKINYLQTDPSNKYHAYFREYSKIGTVILNSLIKIFDKNFVLESTPSARNFYKKYGFERVKKQNYLFSNTKS